MYPATINCAVVNTGDPYEEYCCLYTIATLYIPVPVHLQSKVCTAIAIYYSTTL